MKKCLTPGFLFLSIFSFGQFAVITDKGGSANIRAGGNTNSRITDSLQNGHLIYCFENKGNWTNIDYTKKQKELNGYVYKDRCKLVADFPAIPVAASNENSVKLKKDTIEITLTQRKFEKSRHKIKYYKAYPGQVELIDNKKYWGKDGGLPTTQYDKIIIKIGQRILTLPAEATVGLYQPTLATAEVFVDKETNTIYIQTMNSDGAGSYEVIWKIENGVYTDRLVAYGF
jgi:hypothetical protein